MPDVTICIPTWNAAEFIDRTLECARGQTLRDIRILVSVDQSSDATVDICRKQAAADPRIEIAEHRDRLGWAGNANFLIDQVRSAYFCFYFHDDIIEPTFAERLVEALEARPDAASAHCTMGLFGAREELKPGRSYEGSAAERICRFMLRPHRGSPLRSMTRTKSVGGLRLPTRAPDGFWANEPYLVGLIAAGPALHVDEVLYRRWDKRAGGLTDGWRGLDARAVTDGFGVNAESTFAVVDSISDTVEAKAVARYAVALFLARQARGFDKSRRAAMESLARFIEPVLKLGTPSGLSEMPGDIQAMMREREQQLGIAEAP